MARFIAIPVGQGDAFYLERESFSVLVDGGRGRTSFPFMFKSVTGVNSVNVVVCTHNDQDHANGILGFLESALQCDEVWLPGRWLDVLPDILKPLNEVFVELVENISDMEKHQNEALRKPDTTSIEVYSEQIDGITVETGSLNDGTMLGEDWWPESCIEMLEQSESWELSSHWLNPIYFMHPHFYAMFRSAAHGQLLWSAIDAASRIRAIAIAAFNRGVPVRWFEFNPTAPSGGKAELRPVNASEIKMVNARGGMLLNFLALTVANKESLVFFSPPGNNHPGVMFTADSDLANLTIPSNLDYAITTAPHHGSEANANAYRAVQSAKCSSITWIRSDGRYRQRPGASYLHLKSRRLCTLCRCKAGSQAPKQVVHLYSRSGRWVRHRSSQLCSCK